MKQKHHGNGPSIQRYSKSECTLGDRGNVLIICYCREDITIIYKIKLFWLYKLHLKLMLSSSSLIKNNAVAAKTKAYLQDPVVISNRVLSKNGSVTLKQSSKSKDIIREI